VFRRAFNTQFSPSHVGDGRTVAYTELEGKAVCPLDEVRLAWRRALSTRFTLFYVGVGQQDERGAERFKHALLSRNLVGGLEPGGVRNG
jgi:hypothetical protein